MHEEDVPAILGAMKSGGQREEIDGIVFDYLHFYGNFSTSSKGGMVSARSAGV